MTQRSYPNLGFGLGLRTKHYQYIFDNKPKVDWFEIISENFIDTDGKPKRMLSKILEHYPVVMHGVSLSIGSTDPINYEYLNKLKDLIKYVNPAWISDHLCWTGINKINTHDLLPVPYTEESLANIINRLDEVQNYLKMPIALENPSTYLEFKDSCLEEAQFIAEMTKKSGCNLLLDVNNVYVTCYNHRLDPKQYLDTLPLDSVVQIHLSGHTNFNTHIIDTHDNHIIDEVFSLYQYVLSEARRVPNTMIEWDDKIPEFPVLFDELSKVKKAAQTNKSADIPSLSGEREQSNHGKHTAWELQNIMHSAIISGKNHAPESWIRSKADFAPQAQLDVYVNAYRYRLYDVTAEDYSCLRHYLGNERFHDLVWSFANNETSDHFNISRYCQKLPTYYLSWAPSDRFGHELCILEATVSELYDSPESRPLNQSELAGITAEQLLSSKFSPRAALKLLHFNYNTNKYFQDFLDDKEPSHPISGQTYLAIFRNNDVIWRMDLEETEYSLLQRIFSGMTLEDALQDKEESAISNLSKWFTKWLRGGLLISNISNFGAQQHENAA